MMHSTKTLIAIDTAATAGNGDFYATERALGRFCTEALVDAAEQCEAGLPTSRRTRNSRYESWRRETAIMQIAGWVSWRALQRWSADFSATQEAYASLAGVC